MDRHGWDADSEMIFEGIDNRFDIPDHDREYAETLFEFGWLVDDISPEMRESARDQFFDAVGIPEWQFPWDDWKEWAGYE